MSQDKKEPADKRDKREKDEEFRHRAEKFAPSLPFSFIITSPDGNVVFDGAKETEKVLAKWDKKKKNAAKKADAKKKNKK